MTLTPSEALALLPDGPTVRAVIVVPGPAVLHADVRRCDVAHLLTMAGEAELHEDRLGSRVVVGDVQVETSPGAVAALRLVIVTPTETP